MSKYLLSCSCGQQLAVEPGQAGESLRCDCGRTVAVPTLRQLRTLPVASETPTQVAGTRHGGSAWGIRHGAMTVLVIVAIVSLVLAGVSWWNQPSVPEFNPAGWTEMVDNRLSELTPVAAWKMWVDVYRPLAATGFAAFEHPGTQAIEQEIAARHRMQLILVAVAAGCLIATAATAAAGRSSD